MARLKVVPFPSLLLDSLEMTPARATTGAEARESVVRDAALEAPLFHGDGTSTVMEHRRWLVALVVGLARAFQRDLVLRDLTAFLHWMCLDMRIGLGLRCWLRDLSCVDRMNAVDWSDHDLVL